jgi:hypothetical protein
VLYNKKKHGQKQPFIGFSTHVPLYGGMLMNAKYPVRKWHAIEAIVLMLTNASTTIICLIKKVRN